jgi:hypothetical protein
MRLKKEFLLLAVARLQSTITSSLCLSLCSLLLSRTAFKKRIQEVPRARSLIWLITVQAHMLRGASHNEPNRRPVQIVKPFYKRDTESN